MRIKTKIKIKSPLLFLYMEKWSSNYTVHIWSLSEILTLFYTYMKKSYYFIELQWKCCSLEINGKIPTKFNGLGFLPQSMIYYFAASVVCQGNFIEILGMKAVKSEKIWVQRIIIIFMGIKGLQLRNNCFGKHQLTEMFSTGLLDSSIPL